MQRLFIYLYFVIAIAVQGYGQAKAVEVIPITWKTLADVKFVDEYNKEFDFYMQVPNWGPKVLAVENKMVEITGYVIPVSELGANIIVLSAMPYAQCFFCGGAGPETIMDIKPKKKMKPLKTDKKVTFRGKLKLNKRNLEQLNYILVDAILVEK